MEVWDSADATLRAKIRAQAVAAYAVQALIAGIDTFTWNTTVVAEEAMCPQGKHVPARSRVLNTRCATVRLRGVCPFLKILAKDANE